MEHPVRIVLRKQRTDSTGKELDPEYKTVDIDSAELEHLLCDPNSALFGSFKVIGAEAISAEEIQKKYDEGSINLDDSFDF
ncbi:hypothetical protein ACFOEK_17590 [Litoribrevibacter euphylliae]|uniref:Uncharacterized protein n=1 Tax=Litoribrevibacter euphylliae TaxID=1834034 RepID=A0ABV7HJL0_9GAMM